MSKYTELRIRNRDKHNWVIEGFDPGGYLIEKGPYAGQTKKAGWNELQPIGYYNTLASAAKRMLDEELRILWNGDPAVILEAIAQSEARVLAAVEAALEARGESAKPRESGFVLEITSEQAAEIRDSQAPAKTYLRITGGKRFKRTSDETTRKLTPDEAALERVQGL